MFVSIQNKNVSGFTLIELLVVIAIIGILASVVLGALNSARDKGADAGVKANLATIKNQMAIFYDDNGRVYTGACADATVVNAISAAQKAVSGSVVVGGLGDAECFTNDTEWAIWTNLRSDHTTAWCIDSVGKADVVPVQDSSLVDLTVCP